MRQLYRIKTNQIVSQESVKEAMLELLPYAMADEITVIPGRYIHGIIIAPNWIEDGFRFSSSRQAKLRRGLKRQTGLENLTVKFV